ncbi:MAG TPA: glycosyltransferase family 4 protein [Flavitalea sp.]|nr:glycosyltransferase family 4 protein [Flavitalea sp.]
MKITILQGAFLPVPTVLGGAVEKMWFALAKDFAREGHEVIQVSRTYPGMREEEWIDGVLHKRVKGYSTPSSGFYLKWLDLLYTLRGKKIIPPDSDIIITNTFWAPIILPRGLKKRCVVDVARVPKGQMKWYTRSLILRANSSFVEKAIKKELSPDNHRQVKMIPNPLPFVNSADFDLKEKKNIVLYCGRIHPEKGLELLIQAFKNIQGWTLKIVGPSEISAGGGGSQYLEKLKQLSDQNVEFTGPIFDAHDLNVMYRDASIFVYPSVAEKGETFGLAPLEAMAWGCVPIVSNLECFRDFITHGQNGLVFDHRGRDAVSCLREAIIYMQKETSQRFQMSAKALKVRESHSTKKIAYSFIKEFKKSMNEQHFIH